MPVSCVIGLLWGDEGKGKIIDYLAADADVVVRYAGGHNAGHTIVSGGERHVLHLVPSGAFRADVLNVIGNGVVVDPQHLDGEITRLRAAGARIELGQSFFVSERAHLILPLHRALDQVAEQIRGSGRIGTTGRGIGPTYADRASRSGLRMGDLIRPERLRAGLARITAERGPLLEKAGLEVPDPRRLEDELRAAGEGLAPAIGDTGRLLREAVRADKRVLCEGAQGVLLDVDHGTYPYCTSSSSSTGGIAVGTGLPPRTLSRIAGVVKAYATRVGEGPFPTELHGAEAERLRAAGNEYGSTTQRPRRCGWFDAVAVRYAVAVSGTDALIVTNLDVLSGFDPLRIAVAYRMADGTRTEDFPAYGFEGIEPVWDELPGFEGDITGVRSFGALPAAARAYVEALEQRVGIPVETISVGPGRDQVIRR